MHVETRQTHTRYGDVAGPRRKPEKGAQRPCAGAVSGAVLDTLAQRCQKPTQSPAQATQATLQKRARSKYLSMPLAIRLAELRSPLEKSYRNTVYCASTLKQDGGKLRGRYCGNRWCLVCSRVRTARAINRYKPILDTWTDAQFVTLTVRNVPGDQLSQTLDQMVKTSAVIRRAITRTDKLSFEALRKLECTHNYHQDSYHPHYHAIVNGREQALALRDRWLAAWGDKADAQAQDVRPCTPGSALELFKYATKLASNAGGGKKEYIAPAALDTIFQAMRGRRIWQPVGFTAPATVDEEAEIGTDGTTEALSPAADGVEWEWIQDQHDWVDTRTGELLTGWVPNKAAEAFVTHYAPPNPTTPYGNETQAATAQASGPQTRAASPGSAGASTQETPGGYGRRHDRSGGSGNRSPDARRHCPATAGGRGRPGNVRRDESNGLALAPCQEDVHVGMGSRTLNGPNLLV